MDQDLQSNCAENAPASSHLMFNSHNYETNAVASHVFSVPPPNMYIPSYFNYNQNCPAPLVSGQQINFVVPPFPPPAFQSPAFPSSNYVPVIRPKLYEHSSKPTLPEMQFSCISSQETYSNSLNVGESYSAKFPQNEALNDALWIENWVSKKENKPKMLPGKVVKIGEAKESFKKCIKLLQDLELLKEKMYTGAKHMDFKSWNSLSQNFVDVKNEVAGHILKLPDTTELKKSLRKRSKKRNRLHRRDQERKQVKILNMENRQVLHHKIDSWLKFMQGTIDNTKREESLKKEADSVLSEVLRKKSEGRRQLALVEALLKLRQLRAKSAANQGQHVPPEDGIRFEKVAENLKALWEKQLLEYNVEEQGMRVMLSEAVDERDQSQVTRERHILSQWEKLLFGTRPCNFPEFYLAAEKSVEAFINIRHSWDKFIISDEASIQSTIPIGWTLPSNPSSSDWESLLSTEKSET